MQEIHMTKIKMLAAAVAVASVSTIAMAAAPTAPEKYNTGPLSPGANKTALTEQERVAYALLEGLMQATEGYIHGNGCDAIDEPVKVYSDALGTDPSDATKRLIIGNASLGTVPGIFNLEAVADNQDNFRGQVIEVDQTGDPAMQYINGKEVANFSNTMTYNSANNMMVGEMSVSVQGEHGLNSYSGYVIKDFYKGEKKTGGDNELYLVIDWGLQSLSKEDYPLEKYWQRSKVHHSDGDDGRTVFVKDRLVGVTKCRITISLNGANADSVVDQSGNLVVEKVAPDATSGALDSVTSPAI
jgi:hypothetical protein